MELKKDEQSRNILQRIRRFYSQLINLKENVFNENFRQFSSLEYHKVNPDDIKDLQRLKYLRNLDLAKTGYVNTNISSLIKCYKEKEKILKIDLEVFPIGNIEVKEQDIVKSNILFGFSEKNKSFKVAYNKHNNVSIWKTLGTSRLREVITKLHPTNGNSLQFEHSFYLKNIKTAFPKDWETILEIFNNIIHESFNANKYFKNGVVKLNLDLLKKPSEHLGLPILFPISYIGHQIFKLTEANNQYLVFQAFLETPSKSNTFYFTHDDIKKIYFDSEIDPIAKLKYDLILGVNNGQLFIGNKKDKTNQPIVWNTLNDFLGNPTFSSIVKHYLAKEVIVKKNFVIEEGSIELKNGNKIAYLKKHFNNGEWHYIENGKKNSEYNFRPIWSTFQEDITKKFQNSENLDLALKTINESVLKKSENKHQKEFKI